MSPKEGVHTASGLGAAHASEGCANGALEAGLSTAMSASLSPCALVAAAAEVAGLVAVTVQSFRFFRGRTV